MHTDSLSQVSLLGPSSHKIFSKSHKGHIIINNSDTLHFPPKYFSVTLVDKARRFLSHARMTISDIRKANLGALISEYGSLRALAEKLEHSSTAQISQWKQGAPDSKTGKPRTINNSSARKIEIKCGKPVGWMDVLHNTEDGMSQATQAFQTALSVGSEGECKILIDAINTIINTHKKDERTTELPVLIERRKRV